MNMNFNNVSDMLQLLLLATDNAISTRVFFEYVETKEDSSEKEEMLKILRKISSVERLYRSIDNLQNEIEVNGASAERIWNHNRALRVLEYKLRELSDILEEYI